MEKRRLSGEGGRFFCVFDDDGGNGDGYLAGILQTEDLSSC
jgi:hypothetical protein